MFLISLIAFTTALNPQNGVPQSDETVRAAVQQSVPYIEERGDWWIQKKKCMSCHRVSTMLWSLHEAKRHGFAVSDQLDEWTDWAITESLSKNDKGKIKAQVNREGVAQLLVALQHLEIETTDDRKLTALIVDQQEDDGTWKPCGQLPSQKRPKPETTAVSAMWILMAAAQNSTGDADAIDFTATREFIAKSESAKSTEWYASRLLLAVQDGDATSQKMMAGKLRELQREDGGWGWLTLDQSDALGTGLAVFALRDSGVDSDDDAISRAVAFLLKTQQENGTWKVHGTKANRKDKVQETATYWGTTWAVIALLSILPDVVSG